MKRRTLTALLALVAVALVPGLVPDPGAARASVPPHCHIQRSAYCIWLEAGARMRPLGNYGSTEIELAEFAGLRAHRIVEPGRCGYGPADVIPGYPAPAGVRRTGDGWLHFSLRLRRDGSCDLQISQLVPDVERGTDGDRVTSIPIIICLGDARAANVGGAEVDREFTRQGLACSLRY